MEINELINILELNPAIKLIRAKRYVFIVCFFSEVFYIDNNSGITSADLHLKLETYLERNREVFFSDETDDSDSENQKFLNFNELAKIYIKEWLENEYLTSFQNEDGEIFFELNTPINKTLSWIEKLKKQENVGTDSKLKNIMGMLENLVLDSNTDRERKIAILEEKKREIEREILALKIDASKGYIDDYNIESQCDYITEVTKDFISDLKEVKSNFVGLTRNIYQKVLDNCKCKEIIISSLDYIDELNSTNQGKSFEAFCDIIYSKEMKQKYESYINTLFQLLKEKGLEKQYMYLKYSLNYMQREGKKVWEAKRKMTENLCSLITQKSLSEAEEKNNLLREIGSLLIEAVKKDKKPDIGILLDENEISTPFANLLTIDEERETSFDDNVDEDNSEFDIDSASGLLFNPHAVNLDILRERIDLSLKDNTQVCLFDIIEQYSIEKGLNEIFGYYNLIKNEYKTAAFNWEDNQPIIFNNETKRSIEFPKIIIICRKS